jgi:hypothetical protein
MVWGFLCPVLAGGYESVHGHKALRGSDEMVEVSGCLERSRRSHACEQDLVGAFEMVEDTVGRLLLGRFEIVLYAWN